MIPHNITTAADLLGGRVPVASLYGYIKRHADLLAVQIENSIKGSAAVAPLLASSFDGNYSHFVVPFLCRHRAKKHLCADKLNKMALTGRKIKD